MHPECDCTATASGNCSETCHAHGHKKAAAAAGELQRPHHHANNHGPPLTSSAGPAPGEPSGFLAVPGRAEVCSPAERVARRCVLSNPPLPLLPLLAGKVGGEFSRCTTATTRAASHFLGRPGPGEPSGFLVVPGRAERVHGRPCVVLLPRSPLRAPLRPWISAASLTLPAPSRPLTSHRAGAWQAQLEGAREEDEAGSNTLGQARHHEEARGLPRAGPAEEVRGGPRGGGCAS